MKIKIWIIEIIIKIKATILKDKTWTAFKTITIPKT